ncbi:50S ribosomal protein L31 [candidate division MSBL1 archaeon SCGC-AAA261F19]|uniref:Large ribosomal subunit protein eL31 n=2 Tax=candidate division MSBL1 TaxID=215777 RepID=A0A133V9C8_9EURY|nr:50S ribosomal protein L31 [candidate division MSBL1 archaeon SCGC-AAA261D19]KXB03046.1 50S ribosomal protein L31 [candidate division MSBL1 archaeon SCGC-AAA261F19]
MPEERIFTIPLKGTRRAKHAKRAKRAVKLVKEFLKRHMKSNDVEISQELNQQLWKRGAEKPPSQIRVRAVKIDDGTVKAFLPG